MSGGNTCQSSRWRGFAPFVWLAVAQVFFCVVVASAPGLHDAVHGHDADHHCLAIDLLDGSLDGTGPVPVAAPQPRPETTRLLVRPAMVDRRMPLHLGGSLLEHGPPGAA